MSEWKDICKLTDLAANTGVCALHNGEQVAIFLDGKEQKVHAISNFDPIGKANVLSRGIIGDIKGRLVVASPLYKQHFCLETGECLEEPENSVKAYQVRVEGDVVQLQA
ncbi:nitrite reductase NADPH [Catenovulum agarivorans DS-2]|uniref:Nitrite reductase NADPH n=1 Tax=Catenovulum agarivorans DS-2 TaxID=1328313 RepID=W7QJC4_9ALTE|nr:nitrite reductase small subunit NirD [Catenovulum agarivorans]EWH11986.1 nitrite reductase NADPH [Catenovulum agarivorans DS-2]